ncbi:MAG: IS630 family transposase [bacterium]|nr:IS630 family transposase [bacterium]
MQAGVSDLLKDAPRPGLRKQIGAHKVTAIVAPTLHATPPDATHWSTRRMARTKGVSEATARSIWHAHGLQPHRTETFKLSREPNFVRNLRDVVGLYLNPPYKALVLCVDEENRIPALDRSQPSPPLRPGIPTRQTPDYVRHGIMTLFVALKVLDGTVIGHCQPRHRNTELPVSLKRVERGGPRRSEIHLTLGNYGTHKHLRVQAWFAALPQYPLHFTPTGS